MRNSASSEVARCLASEVLRPLESLREHVTIISGLENKVRSGGACHSAAHSGWLSGVTSKPTEGADVYCGKTLDQYAADVLGKNTLLRSFIGINRGMKLRYAVDWNYHHLTIIPGFISHI